MPSLLFMSLYYKRYILECQLGYSQKDETPFAGVSGYNIRYMSDKGLNKWLCCILLSKLKELILMAL